MKLLIIEDDNSLREIMQRALLAEGYVVETASTFFEACDKIAGYEYDCIMLDIMLPDGNGLRILEQIKSLGKNDRVIIISAKDSLDDKIEGLELGADDYLPKPFYMAELSARIKSVLRRGSGAVNSTMNAGNIAVDMRSRRVTIGGKDIPLLKKEFDILLYFMQRPGHIIDKAVLAEAVWGDHIDMADNFQFVYAQIKNLRKKLAEAGADTNIKAVYGFGYKFCEQTE
jgi:DNA-binding response OmpR family regulator